MPRTPVSAAPKRLLITPGEPAGIGPDLLLQLAQRDADAAWLVAADPAVLHQRALQLGLSIQLHERDPLQPWTSQRAGHLNVWPHATACAVRAGHLDPRNAAYVLATLCSATDACLRAQADAMVTAPVQKSVINDAGILFSGHTEFLADRCKAALPVMMLIAEGLRVALVTTHLPIRAVADAVTAPRLEATLRILVQDLQRRFRISRPRILVCGLNPHAGEAGHLGREELEILIPVLARLREEGMDLVGPLPADTLFTPHRLTGADAVLAMYHDQGLPVLKHVGFGAAVNLTLGLPILRTSVDHGTALDLAGSGRADTGSLRAALSLAEQLA